MAAPTTRSHVLGALATGLANEIHAPCTEAQHVRRLATMLELRLLDEALSERRTLAGSVAEAFVFSPPEYRRLDERAHALEHQMSPTGYVPGGAEIARAWHAFRTAVFGPVSSIEQRRRAARQGRAGQGLPTAMQAAIRDTASYCARALGREASDPGALAAAVPFHSRSSNAYRDAVRTTFEALLHATNPPPERARAYRNHYLRTRRLLPQIIETELAKHEIDVAPIIARLSGGERELLTLAAQHTRANDLSRIARVYGKGAEDGAHVLALMGTYPYDPANPIFSTARGALAGANERTDAFVAAHSLVIPVLPYDHEEDPHVPPDDNARSAPDTTPMTPSERLHAKHLAANPDATGQRTVWAGWDAENGLPVVLVPAAGARFEPDQGLPRDGHGALACTFAAPETITITPEPGRPVFVAVHRESLGEGTNAHPVHPGTQAPRGVHAQSLALLVASALGGVRPIDVLASEETQGALFDRSARRRQGEVQYRDDGTALENVAAVSIPVFGALASAAAARHQVRIWRGAPLDPERGLITRDANHVDLENPIRKAFQAEQAEAKRRARPHVEPKHYPGLDFTFAALYANYHGKETGPPSTMLTDGTLLSLGAAPPADPHAPARERVEPWDPTRAATRPVLRIGALVDCAAPDQIEALVGCAAALRDARAAPEHAGASAHRDFVFVVSEPQLRTPGAGETLQRAIARHFPVRPGARTHALGTHAPPATLSIQPSIRPEHVDLVLLGPIDPGNPEHVALWRNLAALAPTDTAMACLDAPPKHLVPGRATVFGTHADRRRLWGLEGRAQHQVNGPPDTLALIVAAGGRSERVGALAVENFPPILPGPTDSHAAPETTVHAFERILRGVFAPHTAEGEEVRGNFRALPAPAPGRFADRHDLDRAPQIPEEIFAEQNTFAGPLSAALQAGLDR